MPEHVQRLRAMLATKARSPTSSDPLQQAVRVMFIVVVLAALYHVYRHTKQTVPEDPLFQPL